MDFIERLQALSAKIQKQKEMIQTEEATKNAFIMPFINALGYDIFDPTEVIPEFTADVGIKKGEKVDYAIFQNAKVIMLFECKSCTMPLDDTHMSQLYRYFSVTEARIGVLTNGVLYRFYTDLDEPNKMDAKPFMEFNMLDIQEPLVNELKRLTKQAFNIDEIVSVAGDMKYTREIKRLFGEELTTPSDEFVSFLTKKVYAGKVTQSVREQFSDIVKKAFGQFINERINERLRSAMSETLPTPATSPIPTPTGETPVEAPVSNENRIVTTEEELEGFHIVRAILCQELPADRIAPRDTLSYFGILLDDNNRKPICRLYFNGKQKYISFFNAEKLEEKIPLERISDIYRFADRLKAGVALYEKKAG